MREDNLLGYNRSASRSPQTRTTSRVYLNLAARMKLSGINQLWVADITYIRLKAEFVYLAVILDGSLAKWWLGFGSHPSRTAHHRSAGASHRAPTARTRPGASLGSGISIRSRGYTAILEKHHMVPSMSRPQPYDNASCESFMKTLKREEIYANKYDDLENYERTSRVHRTVLQSAAVALSAGLSIPEEFEQKTDSQAESRSATMEFFENKRTAKEF